MTELFLQKIENLLKNFESGELFLNSLDIIDCDNSVDKEFLVSVVVSEYCYKNKVSSDLLKFFLDYYSDKDAPTFACLLTSPTMTLELYKEVEDKINIGDKSFLCQYELCPIEIKEFLMEQLKANLTNEFVLHGVKTKLERDFQK